MPSPSSFRLRQQFAELRQALGRIAQHLGHDRFADLQHFAIVVRANGGERGSPVSKRHFAEAIALAQHPHPDSGAVAQTETCAVPRSMTNIESPSAPSSIMRSPRP